MKHVKRTLLAGLAMLALYGFITQNAPAKFKWSGAWQPTRTSAGDGVTKLDIKIGTFINLPDPASLTNVIFNVNRKFPGSAALATWAVGDLSKLTPAHKGLTATEHEQYLSHMDKAGVTVFLEIFPFKGDDVPAMVRQWLGKFKHHKCVAGLGVELEYFGKATDSLTKVWDAAVKSQGSSYRLFLRHYSPSFMPPTYRGKGDLLFIDDASEGTIPELNKGFADWANQFYPTACAFQLGYPADEDGMNGSNELGWWKLKDPIADWGNDLLPLIKHPDQELGLIWVTAKSSKTYNKSWDLTAAPTMRSAMKPAVKNGGFKMPGYILWCPSVIKVGNTYHMFASRWPEEYKLAGWTKYSEIVRATSDNLYGPYTFQEVVIQKREGHWDNDRGHNPKIVKAGNTFVLYYISSANETGYAYASKITGPWTRTDSLAMPFSNPAPLVKKDGSIYVFGRKAIGDKRIAQGYTAPSFKGPYTLLNEGNNLLPGSNQLEDPTIWWASGQYNVILSDFRGDATGINKNGAQYYSKDGIHYNLVSPESVYSKKVMYDDGSSFTFRRRERPFVFTNEKGEVTAFFTSCLTDSEQSWIEVEPVDKYVPGK